MQLNALDIIELGATHPLGNGSQVPHIVATFSGLTQAQLDRAAVTVHAQRESHPHLQCGHTPTHATYVGGWGMGVSNATSALVVTVPRPTPGIHPVCREDWAALAVAHPYIFGILG